MCDPYYPSPHCFSVKTYGAVGWEHNSGDACEIRTHAGKPQWICKLTRGTQE